MPYRITIQPDGRSYDAEGDKSILESARLAGITLPHACQDGNCGACEGRILAGTVDYGEYQESLLGEDEKAEGLALFCAARPLSDLVIEATIVDEIGDVQPGLAEYRISRLERLCHDVIGMWLAPIAGERMHYIPGQFLDLLLDEDRKRSFSIASAPEDGDEIELHIRMVAGGYFTERLFGGAYKAGDTLRVNGPLGTFFLRDSDRPAILLAGGTGFAPMKSLLPHAFAHHPNRPIALYWGARQLRDLYLPDLPSTWARQHPNFKFVPVLSEPALEDGWSGRRGWVHEAVIEDHPDLSSYQIYACGSPAMVDTARKAYEARGLPHSEFFADAFSFQ
jgi:CDP-4-dehydro-6-deoxyglucose reductase